MEQENAFVLVYPLPEAKDVLGCDIATLLCAHMLMKLAGQVVLHADDLPYLATHYAGFTVGYDPITKTFTAKLRTRPSEYPTQGRA